ncbi:MAG: GAF domain-containing protein [Chloroflexi bacterium]|nr:GAF domain-containing protein [Chloroflexota bacterium]MBU1662315.1 GAF domain-containing protein [Chloroflexota bacterium]
MASEKILLAVSDPTLGKLLKDGILRPAGYQVTRAEDRHSVESLLGFSPVDVVILEEHSADEALVEFAGQLLCAYPALAIILIVSSERDDLVLRALRMGVTDCLHPPLKPADVLQAVRGGLERRKRIESWTRKQTRRNTDILRRRVDVLKELEQIGRSVTASLDLDFVLTAIVDAAVNITGAEEGSLLVLDDDSGELYMRAARNFQDEFVRTFRLPVSDTLAGEVIRTGKPVLLDEGTLQKIKTSYLVRTLMYVPLKIHGRVIGVLGVDNRESKQAFTRHHLALVSTLADYAAIAIENARIYSNTEVERRKFETILDGVEDGVIVVGFNHRVIIVNRTARDAFGIGEDETITLKSIETVFHHAELLYMFTDGHAAYPYRSEFSLDDGRIVNAQLVSIPDVGFAVTMQDITYFKELDRIKSDFVNTVSHDLRSPLTAILGYTELIPRVGEVNDQQREFISRVQISVRNITTLINDLLDLGRIEAGFDTRKELIPLAMIVQYSVDSMMNSLNKKRLKLTLDIPEKLPKILGDPVRLRQIADNLLGNAIRYTPEGGTIVIRLRAERGQVIMQIQDTGLGIPPADQPYIFDKFYRASNVPSDVPGSGLGLAIVKSIVESHLGRIWVDSSLETGSTFTVVIPVADDQL